MSKMKKTKTEMATTPNYGLNLPSLDDDADITKLNENFTKIDGLLKQNESDTTVTEKIEQINTKIGQVADDHTKQTMFGKIADVKKVVSEKVTQIIDKIAGVDGKVGTSSDSSSTSTIFGRLKKVQETTDNINTNMVSKSTVDTINNKIGTSSDSSSSTLFGKIAGVKSDTTKIGYSGQSAGTSSLFAWFQKIKDEMADKITVNNINNKIGTSSDSSGSSTLFGKIAKMANNLSEISVVRKITRGVGVGDTDRAGYINDFVVNVSIVNPSKVVVIINNDFIGRSEYSSSSNTSGTTNISGAYVKEITTQKVTMQPAYYSYGRKNNIGGTFEYCIIEFY